MQTSAFGIGQIVHHRLFGYRGVIFDVDPAYAGSEQEYERMRQSRPPKDRPWYHLLVDGRPVTAYVAESNLAPERDLRPVEHPYLERLFRGFENGAYRPRLEAN